MPNWAYNRIVIKAEPAVLNAIKDFIKGENGAVDFDSILPIDRSKHRIKVWERKDAPNDDCRYYNDEAVGLVDFERVDGSTEVNKHGDRFAGWCFNWYSAQCKVWNTKWNAGEAYVSVNDRDMEITFNTAWSPATPVILALSARFPEVEVDYGCTEESDAFIIDGVAKGGKWVSFNEAENKEIFTPENMVNAVAEELEADGKDPSEYDLEKIAEETCFNVLEYDFVYGRIHATLEALDVPNDLEEYKK